MSIHDEQVFKIVEKIQNHYQSNLNNRYTRKALLLMKVPRGTWDAVDRLTEKSDVYKVQGYQYKELYEMIHAAGLFVHHARAEAAPRLKGLLAGGTDTLFSRQQDVTEKDRILLQMAIENFPANLNVLAELIKGLYARTAALDKEEHPGQKPIYERMPETKELPRLLG
jgi:hypothetical protein